MNKESDKNYFTNSQLIKNQVVFFQIIKHSNIKYIYTGLDKKNNVKLLIFAYPSVFTCFGCSKELSH